VFSAQLEAAGVHVDLESQIGDDLDYLRELELIELDKGYRGGTYRIAVPLLACGFAHRSTLMARRSALERKPRRRTHEPPVPSDGHHRAKMLGRRRLIEQIERRVLKPSPDHVQIVGPRLFGKSVLLKNLVERLSPGSAHYTTRPTLTFGMHRQPMMRHSGDASRRL